MAVAAGAVALPTLLKLSAILESQGQSITSMEELPVELELGKVHQPSYVSAHMLLDVDSLDMVPFMDSFAHTRLDACRSLYFTASSHAQCRRTRAQMRTRQCCSLAVTSSAGCGILVHSPSRLTTMMRFLSCVVVCRVGVGLEDRQESDTQLQVSLLPSGDHSVCLQKDTLPSAHIGLTLPRRHLLVASGHGEWPRQCSNVYAVCTRQAQPKKDKHFGIAV